MDIMEIKNKIIESTIEVYKSKGLKFTMDDIAAEISISKKTIYKAFKDKDDLFMAMVNHIFNKIKESESEVLAMELDTKEKLKRLLAVLPDSFRDIDFTQLYLLKDKYPSIYEEVQKRLESGWEETIALLEKGIAEGVFRPINIPIFKLTFSATLEKFFSCDVLQENGISYSDALEQVTELLVSGIMA